MADPTKGPWRIARQTGGCFEIKAGDVLIAKVMIGDDMAERGPAREPHITEALANAMLIVDASELVDLLRWALGELAAAEDYSSGRTLAELYEEGVAKAEDRANYLRAIALTGFKEPTNG